MKVFTITTHFANNYGALLQSYALSRYLNGKEGVDCEILNYLPDGPQHHNSSWTIFHKPQSFRDILKFLYLVIRVDKIKERKSKNRRMRAFINEYLPVTQKKLYKSTIYDETISADAVICGSDQIWNREIFLDKAYFLDFVPDNIKKIAYAPSIATAWKETEIGQLKPLLERFDALSIREEANLQQVKNLAPNKNVQVVCDPVFLLSSSDWANLAIDPIINGEYIFCYFLGTPDFAVKVVNRLRLITGYKVVLLQLNALDKFNSDYVLRIADPFEFVGLIKKAALVCTNSFHCSAFSLIFKKNLYTIPNAKRNERLENLQKHFNVDFVMSEEKLSAMSKDNYCTDYSNVSSGEAFIQQSKDYLNNALGLC